MENRKPFERLPRNVVPKHYDITLQPNLEKFICPGHEVIQVEVREPTSTVVLHATEQTIEDAKYESSSGEIFKSSSVSLSKENETVSFDFSPAVIAPGSGKLSIRFTGILNDKMKGFYRNKYTAPNGEIRYGACTQFEATDARRAFPCWDEPAIKATFDVTLVAPKDLVTLSNMNEVSETISEVDNNLKVVKFATTPIMSTYLVACVVGEYDYVEDHTVDGIKVRVYTPVGRKEQGLFSLQVATKVLPYYKDYFQVEYPLPKLDLIAISDFQNGAMENWGLVTYRETCLLIDPLNSSTSKKQTVAIIVGHELAHQWFGNIVTMEWWTHLWLNEGFASWIEFLCVDFLFPEYDIWTQFVADMLIQALELDALRNSHPIEVPVSHPSEVDEIFDDISYRKGACIIRMLHDYIGDADFRKGMNAYLTKHKYKNTFTEDLWDALEKASLKPVHKVMSTWTKQMGYPVIKVNVKRDGNSRILSLTQEKFIADGQIDGVDQSSWIVPISISRSNNPTATVQRVSLDGKSTEVKLDNIGEKEWVKLNPGSIGYYRCQYPAKMLDEFLPSIQDKTMPPLDRLGLQDDLFALVQAGHVSTVEILKLLTAFIKEDNYTVWSSICSCLGKLGTLLSHTDCHDDFRSYGRELLSVISTEMGWQPKKDEGHLDALLRSLVLTRMGVYGDEATIVEAKRRFEAYVNGTESLAADLRRVVYHTVMSVGDEKYFETFLKLYRESELHEEKDRLTHALGAIRDEKLLTRVLEFSISDDVRSQDTVFVIVSVSLNKYGRDLAWQFFKDNWSKLAERYDGGYLIARLVKHLTENFASEDRAKEVESFFKEHPISGTERTVLQSIESIRLNARWLDRDSAAISQWLKNRK